MNWGYRSFQERVNTKSCSRKSTTISRCIEDFLDARSPNCTKQDQLNNLSCPAAPYFSRMKAEFLLRIAGYDKIVGLTGCRLPCTRYRYDVTPSQYDMLMSIIKEKFIDNWENSEAVKIGFRILMKITTGLTILRCVNLSTIIVYTTEYRFTGYLLQLNFSLAPDLRDLCGEPSLAHSSGQRSHCRSPELSADGGHEKVW